MISRTTAFAVVAAVGGVMMWGASLRGDSNYWQNRAGVAINVGQGVYFVPAISQPVPKEEPEGPAIQAAYREEPEVSVTKSENTPTPVQSGGYYYSFGNGRVWLPAK